MAFTENILAWYNLNKRDLPWRKTKDPYLIWVSEVILQQTRVEQGLNYYLQFVEVFPTIDSLAKADERDVLKIWQGLGYYSRARNLHSAAKDIIENHNGVFPGSFEKIVGLKGVGQYTAAAIASIAFGLPHPVVDGNILRFFSRYFGIDLPVDSTAGRKKIHEKALSLIDRKQPGIFNQAVMEFGALQCTPGKPGCSACPLKKTCRAFKDNIVEKLPVKRKLQRQRIRYFHYMVIVQEDENKRRYVFMKKREEKDVWQNLYDFPLIESDHDLDEEEILASGVLAGFGKNNKIHLVGKSNQYRHILSHQVIFARFYMFSKRGKTETNPPFPGIALDEIKKYPVSRLIEQFLDNKMVDF